MMRHECFVTEGWWTWDYVVIHQAYVYAFYRTAKTYWMNMIYALCPP